MPTNVKVIRASDFIRAKPEGAAYLEEAEKLLKDIVAAGCGLGRFFALCAENRGFNISVFTSYEEAMNWLIGD
jgi:hypothetical protein